MIDNSENIDWLKSTDARKKLKIKDCDLMHLRLEGKLKFKKKGNAFYYSVKDIENILKLKNK